MITATGRHELILSGLTRFGSENQTLGATLMSMNATETDALFGTTGFDSIAIAPGREPLSLGRAVSTNHQPDSSWPIYEEKVQTHARYQHLESITAAGGQAWVASLR